ARCRCQCVLRCAAGRPAGRGRHGNRRPDAAAACPLARRGHEPGNVMNAEERGKLRRILASFHEAGLVALANKGLPRRAQKDLESGGVSHEEMENDVLVRGPGWTVTMPTAGPACATDDTKASGTTRQILTATLYLQQHWAKEVPADTAPSSDAESLADALLAL